MPKGYTDYFVSYTARLNGQPTHGNTNASRETGLPITLATIREWEAIIAENLTARPGVDAGTRIHVVIMYYREF